MGQYRKKPVVIEARKVPEWPGGEGVVDFVNECVDLAAWCGGRSHMMHSDDTERDYEGDPGTDHILIPTLEGDMRANPGDFIIKGVRGEFYPCKPDIFEATYEAVAE